MTAMFDKTAQRDDALAKANRLRFAAADFKAGIGEFGPSEGARKLADFFEADLPADLTSMRVVNALMAVRYIGDLKARTILRSAGVGNSGRYIRDLTRRQRYAIAEELRYFAERYEALKAL